MTLILELTPDMEVRLTQEASKHGLDASAYAIRLINNQLPEGMPEPAVKTPRVLTGYGKFAHLPGSVDDYLRRKQEEIEHEEERSRRRMGQQP